MTGLTGAEFQGLLPHFEQAFVPYMYDCTIDGQPRASRRYSTYDTCPWPTIADKLLFILTYLNQNPIQEAQGQLFGESQSHANKWIHMLHPVLNQALADRELLPAQTAVEFAVIFETSSTDGRSTTEGKALDKSLAELAGYTLPAGSCLYQEKGFQGFCLHDVTIVQAKKKAARRRTHAR